MDIKSKKYDAGKGRYIFAFVLCVTFFIAAITAGVAALKSAIGLNDIGVSMGDAIFCTNYAESGAMLWDFETKFYNITYLMNELKGEDYIKAGNSLNQGEVDARIESLYYQVKEDYDSTGFGEEYVGPYNDFANRERFFADYEEEIAGIKDELIMRDLRTFERIKKDLDEEGFLYYAANGRNAVTNLFGINMISGSEDDANKDVEENPALDSDLFLGMAGKSDYVIYENGQLIKMNTSSESFHMHVEGNDRYLEDRFNYRNESDSKVYLAFGEKYLAGREATFQENKKKVTGWISIAAALGLILVLSFVYLVVMTGRKDAEGRRPEYKIDRVFTELQLLIIALCFFGGGALCIGILMQNIYDSPSNFINTASSLKTVMLFQLSVGIIVGLAASALGLLFILSCIRNLKSGRFISNFLIYIVFSSIFSGIRSIYYSRGFMTRVILLAVGLCVLSATVFGVVAAIAFILIFASKWIRKYENIKIGIEEVKNGNLSYEIPISGDSELDELAKSINMISEASNKAVQNELKNQRLKTDLISNVSHDLKTPLTSIITYVDLLKKENSNSENIKKYLEIVEQKSLRLKKLTDDLFDAAKASSGSIPVKLETVDMLSLLNQGLGEMAASVESSSLIFIINAKEKGYCAIADGQLIWRVLENLLGNVLKYSLQGSRVYIDLKKVESINGDAAQILLEIKNISKTELNIGADELMERFKRGDESRATEGSGLGLAIARDLVILQNGRFELKIDGDLFKVTVMLPRSSQENQ